MSRMHLEQTRARTAFPHTLAPHDLGQYHVPFDELTGRSDVEAELAHWMVRRGRVALIGSTGSGKSSALAWVTESSVADSITLLRIPVALAEDETVQSTGGFARHIVRHTLRAAHLTAAQEVDLRSGAADAVQRGPVERRSSARAGVNLGVLNGELAQEIARTSGEFEEQVLSGEVVQALQRLIELMRDQGGEPFLLFDDTDTWISRPNDAAPAALAEGFFGRNVRMLTSELDCGFVVAVHPTYLPLPTYQRIAQRLESIRIPQLAHPDRDLTRILDRRLRVAGVEATVDDVFQPEAIRSSGVSTSP